MKPLGIHHMSAIDTSPTEFAMLAADAGYDAISAFAYGDPQRFPLLTGERLQQFKDTLRTTGLKLVNIDAFMLLPNSKPDDYFTAVDLGTELGARCVSTQIFDDNQQRVIDTLGRLCEYSAKSGLAVSIEFMAFSPIANSLQDAVELVKHVGQANLGISIDILHLIRTGGKPEDITRLDPALIRNAQLCDSNDLSVTGDYAEEAMSGRLIPGQGKFPLREFLSALPENVALELEIPNAGIPARQRVESAIHATRKLLE